jgi:sensor histidine kinase regulating citrate/malate metabolism
MLATFLGYVTQMCSGSPVLERCVQFSSFTLIIVYVAKVIKKPYLKLLDTLQKGWGFISLIPLILIGIIILLQYTPTFQPENVPVLSLVFAMTFVFYTIVFLNFKNILEYLQIRQEKELMTVQAQMYKNEYNELIGHVDGMRMFRHDIRHHISAINAFLQDGNTKEAKDYLMKLDGSLTSGTVRKYCENNAINAILSSLISRANSEGVSVDCLAVISEDIAIDSMDLGLIFANALDNAINACRNLTDPAGRNIRVNCREHCGQLYMSVSNPFQGDVRFDGEFPVSKDREHGIGTRSIASITEKYDGSFSFTAKDSVFNTTITLNQKTTGNIVMKQECI